jgi:hypothetical protein
MEMRSWDMPWHTSEGVTKLRSHTWVVTGRLRPRGRLAAGEAAYVRSLSTADGRYTSWSADVGALPAGGRRRRCVIDGTGELGGVVTARSGPDNAAESQVAG